MDFQRIVDLKCYINEKFNHLKFNDADISKPKGSRIQEIYSTLLMDILDLPEHSLTDMPPVMMHESYDHDVHGKTIPKFLLSMHLSNFLNDITDGVLDCTPRDIIYPDSDKTRRILAALASYHRFRGDMRPHMDLIEKHQRARKEELDALRAKVANAQAQDYDTHIEKVLQDKIEAEQNIERQAAEQNGILADVNAQKEKSVKLEQQKTELQAEIASINTTNSTIRSEIRSLEGDIVSSPKKIMNQVAKFRVEQEEVTRQHEQHHKTCNNTKARVHTYKNVLNQLISTSEEFDDLKKQVDGLQPKLEKTEELRKQRRQLKLMLESTRAEMEQEQRKIAEEKHTLQRQAENHTHKVNACNEAILQVQSEIDALRARGEKADHELEQLNRDYQNVIYERGLAEAKYERKMKRIQEAMQQNETKMKTEQAKWQQFVEEKKSFFTEFLNSIDEENDENVKPEPMET